MNKIKHKPNGTKEEKKDFSLFPEFLKEQRFRVILGITLSLCSLYILLALVGFFFCGGIDQSLVDTKLREVIVQPEIIAGNPAGKIGAWISDLLINRWFGISSLLLCYLLLLCGIRIAGGKIKNLPRKLFIGMVIILWISLLLGFIAETLSEFFDIGTGYLFLGGGHGYFVSLWLNSLIGHIGTILLLFLVFTMILFFGFEKIFYQCVEYIKESIRKRKERALAAIAAREARQEAAREEALRKAEEASRVAEMEATDLDREAQEEAFNPPHPMEEELGNYPVFSDLEDPEDNKIEETDDLLPDSEETTDEESIEHGFENIPVSINDFQFDKEIAELNPDEDTADLLTDENVEGNREVMLTVNNKDQEETVDRNILPTEDYDPTLDLSNYQYPALELLEEHSTGNPKVTQEELEENKNKIIETLRNYKIEIVKIKATIGPTVTLYEIIPAPGIKISKIKNLEDDIALSLAALGIRIIAPIPGAGTIGIEVPNQNPEIVSMRGVIASKKFQESKYALPVAIGRTISNETYTFDLAKMPHLLIAGATGQGKSVGLNAVITSLLYKKHPSQLKFVMVDPKKVELSIYSIIEKHFLAKLPDEEDAIITETSKVVNTLNSLCIEMDNRYDLLKIAQVRNIKEYNEKFIKRHLNPNNGHKYLPYIVVVVDEFADLIMTAGKEVETPIARIAQLARAVGIHMIIATQRPSTNIITGVIKANFPARIAFKVASMIDSRTILDANGAERLIGRGDMLISSESKIVRVQCAFVDTPEIDVITHHIASQQSYPSAFALPEYIPDAEGNNLSEIDLGARDPLFDEAARLIVSSQQGSTSSIQRRFSIGYNRAGRIMDQMEAAGIVGAFEGSKARQVLITDDYSLEQMLNRQS
ncbi:MAG: DNA translocase FtsK [Odoribacter sp.]